MMSMYWSLATLTGQGMHSIMMVFCNKFPETKAWYTHGFCITYLALSQKQCYEEYDSSWSPDLEPGRCTSLRHVESPLVAVIET